MDYKICFYKFGLEDPNIKTWFSGMYQSFFQAIEERGCKVIFTDSISKFKSDVLVVPMGGGQDRSSAQAMKAFGGPVILSVGAAKYWFRKEFLERWREQILFTYGMDRSEYSIKKFSELGIAYYHLPFASNPEVMKPISIPKKSITPCSRRISFHTAFSFFTTKGITRFIINC